MAKSWVITIEPTDNSSPERIVETISNRIKIAKVEEHLCDLYRKMVAQDSGDLNAAIKRKSGFITCLEQAPYRLKAELKTENA